MKKSILLILIISFSIAALSCVTRQQNESWHEFPPAPFFWVYKTGNVSVTVDHVKEENIEHQLSVMAGTFLESRQKKHGNKDKILLVDITVTQRSIMKNFKMYNSVFVSCAVSDDKGTVYALENEYISGRKTFVEAAEQNTIITRVLNRLLSYQQKQDIKNSKKQAGSE